ncbi:restriction endonuclease subunit S [Bacillus sp. HNG]|uniref:restriction endonuclease subunit S n=1 Tax=Bacillus sp. HNG TaxID=2293325 RepID=UPI001CB8F1F9|nr:restriction endonuclease subunit S [Bacillus sp. HNG]
MKNKHIPEIRFQGFTGDWKQHKLEEGTLKIGDGLHGTPQYSPNGNIAFINGNNLLNGKIVINSETKYVTSDYQSKDDKELNQNTILMSINGTIGNLAWYNGEKVMLGKSAAYIEVSSFDKHFMYQLLQTRKIKNYFLKNLTGTTIKNLGLKTIRETPTLVPKIDEQKKIGQFFKQLDDTITFYQHELAALKQTKQGFLQKMFPKEGESVPDVRFPGFTGEWELRKLGEVVNITMGQSPNGENYTENPDDHILVQGNADIKNGWVSPRIWTTQITKTADKGDIIISVRAPVGDVGKTQYDVVLGRGVAGIKGNEFIFQYLSKMKSNGFWKRYSTGSTFESINSNDLKEAIISIPEEAEQTKIGSFFKQLDDTIALHQRELYTLKETKKAFLQKMFV